MQLPDDTDTLPDRAGENDSSEQLSMFGRVGQLALPGAEAQLGLDGVAYAVTAGDDSDRSPERASHSLGTHTVFSHGGDLHPTDADLGLVSPLQLQLDLDAWDEAPQLVLWNRNDRVRDLTNGGEFDRDGKCNRTRFSSNGDVGVARSARGSWSTSGTIKCGQWQTCPSCGPRKCREVASKLSVAFDRHQAKSGEHDVWMLTLTVPHDVYERAADTVDRLYAADAALLRSREWREFCERWNVVGRVRVLDATHGGAHGSHPHFHVALFVEGAGLPTDHAFVLGDPGPSSWTVDERGGELRDGVRVMPTPLVEERDRWGVWKPLRACSQEIRKRYLDEIKGSLVVAWERVVRATGARIERLTDFRRKSVELTPSENAAAYFVKWGLADEVGASSSKSRNHLRLLDAVAAGIKGAAYTWKEWRRAVAQRALVTGLKKIVDRLNVTDEDAQAWLDEHTRRREAELERAGTPVVKVPELQLVVRSHLYAGAMKHGWARVFEFVDACAAEGSGDAPDWLQQKLDGFLWSGLALSSDSDSS